MHKVPDIFKQFYFVHHAQKIVAGFLVSAQENFELVFSKFLRIITPGESRAFQIYALL